MGWQHRQIPRTRSFWLLWLICNPKGESESESEKRATLSVLASHVMLSSRPHCGITCNGGFADLGEVVWRNVIWTFHGLGRSYELLLHQLPEHLDLQGAWPNSPPANHALRMVPPDHVATCAVSHDAALWDSPSRGTHCTPLRNERAQVEVAEAKAQQMKAKHGLIDIAATMMWWSGWRRRGLLNVQGEDAHRAYAKHL